MKATRRKTKYSNARSKKQKTRRKQHRRQKNTHKRKQRKRKQKKKTIRKRGGMPGAPAYAAGGQSTYASNQFNATLVTDFASLQQAILEIDRMKGVWERKMMDGEKHNLNAVHTEK